MEFAPPPVIIPDTHSHVPRSAHSTSQSCSHRSTVPPISSRSRPPSHRNMMFRPSMAAVQRCRTGPGGAALGVWRALSTAAPLVEVNARGSAIAELRLQREPVNSLNTGMLKAITDAVRGLEADPEVDAIIVRSGTPNVFCAGRRRLLAPSLLPLSPISG